MDALYDMLFDLFGDGSRLDAGLRKAARRAGERA